MFVSHDDIYSAHDNISTFKIDTNNHHPVFKQWLYYISTVNYYKKEKSKLESLNEFKDKLRFINNRDIKK